MSTRTSVRANANANADADSSITLSQEELARLIDERVAKNMVNIHNPKEKEEKEDDFHSQNESDTEQTDRDYWGQKINTVVDNDNKDDNDDKEFPPFEKIDRGMKGDHSTPLNKKRAVNLDTKISPEQVFRAALDDYFRFKAMTSKQYSTDWLQSMKDGGEDGKLFLSQEFTHYKLVKEEQLLNARFIVLNRLNNSVENSRLLEVLSFERIPFLRASFKKLFPKVLNAKENSKIKTYIDQKIEEMQKLKILAEIEKKEAKKGSKVSATSSSSRR